MSNKTDEYAKRIGLHLAEIFNEESENHISPSELIEGDNLTDFIHALATLAPALIYRRLTGDKVNALKFNHIANQLVFQYSTKTEATE